MENALGGFFDPRRTPLDDRIGVDQELSGAGDEGCDMRFAFCSEATIEVDQSLVPSERGRERRGNQ
jgi:hypothetical protein